MIPPIDGLEIPSKGGYSTHCPSRKFRDSGRCGTAHGCGCDVCSPPPMCRSCTPSPSSDDLLPSNTSYQTSSRCCPLPIHTQVQKYIYLRDASSTPPSTLHALLHARTHASNSSRLPLRTPPARRPRRTTHALMLACADQLDRPTMPATLPTWQGWGVPARWTGGWEILRIPNTFLVGVQG